MLGRNVQKGVQLPYQGWRNTKLWNELVKRGGPCENLRHYLTSWLDDVETLLSKGGTAPPDFTLHDDEHSFRVAERMFDLLPQATLFKLSNLELGLLLSSAYLHDIGMNPRREVVGQIRDYLFSGDRNKLNPEEARNLQQWLDEAYPEVQPPVLVGESDTKRLHRAEFLTAFFCRHRHNDWSGSFILEHAKGIRHPPYVNWVQDLVTLCKSHHYGLPRLMEPIFDLRLAGSEEELVNLRYLAAILRVADVLEFDPERTPQVVLTHRSPVPQSSIYWYKDHEISLALEQGSWSISLQARTRDAWTHQAVKETADSVDRELENCATMERQNAFLRGKKIVDDESYRWRWPARLARTIEPMPDTFVEIDGAFRPNAERILALLAGTQLYRTPLAAVRELLQNAFDAVKEQIAWELLLDSDPSDSRVKEARSLLHNVKLALDENQQGELWLTCFDTGVGMTRRVIEKYLLVSGSQFRPEVLELRREAAAKGVKLERSGEFGIGVLSYFMLADKMVIETRAAPGIELDQENHGWLFETEGLSSVGELRALSRHQRGTLIKLRIKESMKTTILSQEFLTFVDDLLIRTPCSFEFRHANAIKSYGPGWAWQDADLRRRALELRFPVAKSDALNPEEEVEQFREEFRTLAFQQLKLYGPLEYVLPNEIGVVRIHVPYFDMDGEPSVLLFETTNGLVLPFQSDKEGYDLEIGLTLRPLVRRSWRGFSTSIGPNEQDTIVFRRYRGGRQVRRLDEHRRVFDVDTPLIVEVDIVDQATISINRESLSVKDSERVEKAFDGACEAALRDFAKFQSESRYAEITLGLFADRANLPNELKSLSGAFWIFPANAKEDLFVWKKIAFPAILNLDGAERDVRLGRSETQIYLDEIRPFQIESALDIEPLDLREPTRIVLCPRRGKVRIGMLFEEQAPFRSDDRLIADFPEEWTHVAIIEYGIKTIYNRHSPLCKQMTSTGWRKYLEIAGSGANRFQRLPFARGFRQNIVAELAQVAKLTPDVASAFILGNWDELSVDDWNSLKREAPENWATVFGLAGLRTAQDFVVRWEYDSDDSDGTLTVLSIDGAKELVGYVEPGGHPTLPLPKDPRWLAEDSGPQRKR